MSHPPRLSIITAMAKNQVIGLRNRMPWHLPADLKRFKAITMGKPMIMGRKTWESLPGLLPGRHHIVLSNNADYPAKGCDLVHSLEQAIALATLDGTDEIMIIGGANLYQQALPLTQRIYLTRLELDIEGDAFFPHLDDHQWIEIQKQQHAKSEHHGKALCAYSFMVLERRSSPM